MNVNDDLKNRIKFKIAMLEINKEEQNDMKKMNFNKKSVVAACALLTLSTGVVFAKDIEKFIKNTFGLGSGIDTAVENGYIENPEMEYLPSEEIEENISQIDDDGTILDNINSEIKIDDFLMDDYNLSADFSIRMDDTISDYIEVSIANNVRVTFPDLIIIDENNNIIYTDCDENRFNKFCNEHNLDYKYHEFNEHYMNNGLNNYLNYVDNFNGKCTISNKYNMYTATEFPKSKKLIFDFTKIRIEKPSETGKNEDRIIYTTLGNWNIELDVPEKMYNRSSEHYKVINCENENFDIYTAKVSDTGFEIGITLNNTPRPEIPEELLDPIINLPGATYIFNTREQLKAVSKDEEFEKLYIEYQKQRNPVQYIAGIPQFNVKWLENQDGCWVENSNGEKFYCTMNPARKANHNFINDNTFDFYETFDMTKTESTDRIKVVINYYGEYYNIELEKIKK